MHAVRGVACMLVVHLKALPCTCTGQAYSNMSYNTRQQVMHSMAELLLTSMRGTAIVAMM